MEEEFQHRGWYLPAMSSWVTRPNTSVLSPLALSVRGDLEGAVRRMKQESGPGIVILGSGSIVSQLTAARLIDEYQLAVCPIVLGSGRTMFSGIPEPVTLALRESRAFKNGNVVLRYELAA